MPLSRHVNGFALCVGDRQLVELVAVLCLYGNSNRAALGSRGLVDRNRTVIRLGSRNRGARAGGRAAAAARMMHGEVCGDGGVAVDGKGLRSAALNCLAVYRPTTEVIAAVCGRGEGDKRIRLHLCAIFLISSYRAVCTGRVVQRIEAVDRNFSVGFGVLERISVILGIRSHIRVIGKQNQCQLVACLDRIVGRLEIQSIIIILAVLQFNLVCSRSGVKACTRFARSIQPCAITL